MGRLAVAVAVASWAVPVSLLVNAIVPYPYMDEIFHVPQTQKYCNMEFASWDPMITTPPGLYFLSLAYVGSLFPGAFLIGVVKSLPDVCSTSVLRSVNIIAAIICGILIHDIVLCLRPDFGKRKTTLYAILVTLFPVHWFFTFLYYTDIASLAFVLAMYLAVIKRRFWLGAMFGAFSILFRQTNIIWMLFFAANGALSFVHHLDKIEHVPSMNDGLSYGLDTSLNKKHPSNDRMLRRRNHTKSVPRDNQEDALTQSHQVFYFLSSDIVQLIAKLWAFKWKVLYAFFPFAVVTMVFIGFVLWNGSIVLGAKEAHVVSLHLAQMLYFGLFSAGSLLVLHFTPHQFTNIFSRVRYCNIGSSLLLLMTVGASFIAVEFFSIAHPYLLADNRHYPFYLWRKLIQANWMMKYLLIPFYVYSWYSIIYTLGKFQTRIWVLSYVISVALVIVPAPLIEFRYFTIPFVIMVVHSSISENELLLLGLLYAAVNVFTMAMFLFRPFRWDHEPGTQRFMW